MVAGRDQAQLSALAALCPLLSRPALLVDRAGDVRAFNAAFVSYCAQPDAAFLNDGLLCLIDPADQQGFAQFLDHDQADGAGSFQTKLFIGATTIPLLFDRLRVAGQTIALIGQVPVDASGMGGRPRILIESLDQAVWDYDIANHRFSVSDAWRRMRGVPPSFEVNEPQEQWLEANVHPEDQKGLEAALDDQIRGQNDELTVSYRTRHADGHWVTILCRSSVMAYGSDGLPARIAGTDTDISNFEQNQMDLLQMTSKLQLAVEASGMGIWEYDPRSQKVHWDDRMLEIYGLDDGQNDRSEDLWGSYIHPEDVDETLAYSDECEKNNADFSRDYRIVRQDGEVRHIRSMARFVGQASNMGKLIGINLDITADYERAEELEQVRRQLEYDSKHDALTGLANRRYLDELTDELFRSLGPTDRYGVLHLDLDHFKQINDTLGHAVGDAVLTHVAHMLRTVLGDNGLPCRIGGDELMVFFANAPSDDEIAALCEALLKAFELPLVIDGHVCAMSVSMGYASGVGVPQDPKSVFVNADLALYAAKDAGRARFRIYSDKIKTESHAAAVLVQRLRDAVLNGELICHYQPQFAARSMQLVGVEALIRWQCPERGLLTPDAFLPVAEEAGLLSRMDESVFEIVIAQQSDWSRRGFDFPKAALNISAERLMEPDLIAQIKAALQPYHRISFELLETSFVDHVDTEMAGRIAELRALGIQVEMDDFGSGYSSIVALQSLRPDAVKIDRSLVAPIASDPTQIKLLRALVEIARFVDARVVVEGLERDAHLAAIQNVDCDVLQGFALSRPLNATDLERLFTKNADVVAR